MRRLTRTIDRFFDSFFPEPPRRISSIEGLPQTSVVLADEEVNRLRRGAAL